MKLLLAISVAASAFGNVLREPLPICPGTDGDESIYFPSYEDCTQFYQCSNGIPLLQDCPGGLYFDAILNVCNWAESEDAANCAGKPTGIPTLPSTESQATDQPTELSTQPTQSYPNPSTEATATLTTDRSSEAYTTDQTTELYTEMSSGLPGGNYFCHSDGCFQYLLIPTFMTFSRARDACLSLGADLVSIHNTQEDIYVRNMTVSSFWTGLNDINIEGRYEWSDGSTYQYGSWAAGQPNDYKHSENCVLSISCVNGCVTTNTWSDTQCSSLVYPVCKK